MATRGVLAPADSYPAYVTLGFILIVARDHLDRVAEAVGCDRSPTPLKDSLRLIVV
jgi:hypothetical protein